MNTLPDTAAIGRVNDLQEQIESHQASAVEKAVEIGAMLHKMKALIVEHKRRNWMTFCHENIFISRSNINNYMACAAKSHLLADYQRAGNCSIRGFLKYTGEVPQLPNGSPPATLAANHGGDEAQIERKRHERKAKREAGECRQAVTNCLGTLDSLLEQHGSDMVMPEVAQWLAGQNTGASFTVDEARRLIQMFHPDKRPGYTDVYLRMVDQLERAKKEERLSA